MEASPKETPEGTGQMTADQLMANWHRVGTQIYEIARELFEESNHNGIGDRTYIGFVNSVLNRIPGVSTVDVDAPSFGYLIYLQRGPLVTEKVTDLMPGDIISLHNAKLKSSEDTRTYHLGIDERITAVGIVGEYRPRKSTVKVYQAGKGAGQHGEHR